MEHWEELKANGLQIVWDDVLFRPGTDSFLLSAFPRLKPGLRVCDLGSGTGLLGLLLLQREPSLDVTGIELQPEAAALAERCAAANGLDGQTNDARSAQDRPQAALDSHRTSQGRLQILQGRPRPASGRLRTICADFRQARDYLPSGGFDCIVSNPPYYDEERGKRSADDARRLARSGCTLSDVVQAAAFLLRNGGAFCLCQKPERLTDALCLLREAGCEPKRLRFACRTADAAPSLFLLEGRRGGRPGLSVEPPLILYREDGSPTAELDRIYFRDM